MSVLLVRVRLSEQERGTSGESSMCCRTWKVPHPCCRIESHPTRTAALMDQPFGRIDTLCTGNDKEHGKGEARMVTLMKGKGENLFWKGRVSLEEASFLIV